MKSILTFILIGTFYSNANARPYHKNHFLRMKELRAKKIQSNSDLKVVFKGFCQEHIEKSKAAGAQASYIEDIKQDCESKISDISDDTNLSTKDLRRVSEYTEINNSKESRDRLSFRYTQKLMNNLEIFGGGSNRGGAVNDIRKVISGTLLPFAVVLELISFPITKVIDTVQNRD